MKNISIKIVIAVQACSTELVVSNQNITHEFIFHVYTITVVWWVNVP